MEISRLLLFLLLVLLAVGQGFNVVESTIDSIRQEIVSRRSKCSDIIARFVERIQRFERFGGSRRTNAIIQINPNAVIQARAYDSYSSFRRLHCVPIVIKANVNCRGLATSGANLALATTFPTNNSYVVNRLLAEEGIVVATANMYEFAFGGIISNSTLGGLILNAYNMEASSYGSSGGTGVAIAASFGVVGIGSDTSGSITLPSSASSVVGLRATQDLIPLHGVLPCIYHQDAVGPMCRTAKDTKTVFEILRPSTSTTQKKEEETKSIKNAPYRIGLVSDFLLKVGDQMIPDKEVIDLTNQAKGNLERLFTRIPNVNVFLDFEKEFSKLAPSFMNCTRTIIAWGINTYLKASGGFINNPMKSLKDVSDSMMVLDDIKIPIYHLGNSMKYDDFRKDPTCEHYFRARKSLKEFVYAAMNRANVDYLLMPGFNQKLHKFKEIGVKKGLMGSVDMYSITGLPVVNFPIGYIDDDLPLGVNVIGREMSEMALLDIAEKYEAAHKVRKSPRFRNAHVGASAQAQDAVVVGRKEADFSHFPFNNRRWL